jgi:preprotein translocase subunit YajC
MELEHDAYIGIAFFRIAFLFYVVLFVQVFYVLSQRPKEKHNQKKSS